MIPISSTAPRPAAAGRLRMAEPEARPASPAASSGSLKPVRDEYVPGEKRQESYGRYWMGKDEDGSPKIYFDDPEAAGEAPSSPQASAAEEPDKDGGPDGPEKAAPAGKGRKAERCTGNTDAVDREIKKLKEKKEKLEKQLSSETDEAKMKELERKLSQVENELRQKDNDAYRRRHSTFTEG